MEKLNEIGLTLKKSEFNSCKIKSSRDAVDCIRQFYGTDIGMFESFFLLILNNANLTIGYVKISQGGTAGTVVDPKIIAKYAIDSLATSVILAHNHPSGNLIPSESDKNITQKIKQGLLLFDIKTLDHIILTEDSFYSFMDDGIM